MTDESGGVTERMEALCLQWGARGDGREVFIRCYSMMTQNMLRAIDAAEFRDSMWVDTLLRRFADYYFDALVQYEAHSVSTPAVWRTAHEAALVPETAVLQHLLLGVNAHINYDLVLALVDALQPEWHALSPERRDDRYLDHCLVNAVIGSTIDAVQDSLLEPREPRLAVVDVILGPVDEWIVSRLISCWRDRVWANALAMLALEDDEARESFRLELEAATEARADVITLRGGLGSLQRLLD